MTTKKTILTTLFLLVAGTVAMYGQIPAEVTDLIEKSKAKMQHASGVTMEMNVHVSILLIKTDMAMTVSEKGGKSLSKASMKMMGRELVVDLNFDGKFDDLDWQTNWTEGMNIVALRRHSSRQGAHRRPDVRRRVSEQPV